MSNTQDPLKRVRVATPCAANWERMAGDERARHCTMCELNVYNFAEMTRDEIRTLLLEKEGRICARLYRRADGTLLTRDCPSRIQVLRQRTSRFASAIVAGVMFAFGCATSTTPRKDRSQMQLEVAKAATATQRQATLTGIVVDPTGTPLPGVTITACDDTRELTVVTDENGMFAITSVNGGTYRLEAMLAGFDSARIENLTLKESEVTRARVTMGVDASPTMGIVVSAERPMVTHGVHSTTFSSEFMDTMPLRN